MRIANSELHPRVELKILLIIETMHACILNKGDTWRSLGFLIRDMEDMVIPDVMNDVFLP